MTTRSPARASKYHAAPLSPEVEWYLESRGYSTPTCGPLIRTPEPRNVKGAYFNPDLVDAKIKALSALRHTKGRWAGQPIVPTAEQVGYIIAPIFGWVKINDDGDEVRLIRNVYVEMPRKGAKTTLVSGLSMIMAFADHEPGAEVIMGAGSRDQAGAAFKPLVALTKASRTLQSAGVTATKKEINQESTSSSITTTSSIGSLAHGANLHAGLLDELHVHKNDSLLEAMETGTGARRQPIIFIITTADTGSTTSVYAQRRDMIEKLAAKTLTNPGMYGVVWAATENDDPFSETTWAKANPLYPTTPSRDYMIDAAAKAQANPTALASFLRLHLGIRTGLAERFIDLRKWDANASVVDRDKLAGREAFGGLDLGSVSDLTALVWVLPDDKGIAVDVVARFYLPEDALPSLDARTVRTASVWAKNGWLTLTPGDVTDYDWIKRDVLTDLQHYNVRGIGYDRWNATQLVIDLENDEDAPMVKVGQGVVSLSAPLKEIDRRVRLGSSKTPVIRHGGNPVLRWCADNLRIKMDESGNIKPDKAKSMDKIDGMSALTTAMSVMMGMEPEFVSAYAERGVEVI